MLIYRYIRDETELTSTLTRYVGNVTKDTDITFEYGVRQETSKSVHIIRILKQVALLSQRDDAIGWPPLAVIV